MVRLDTAIMAAQEAAKLLDALRDDEEARIMLDMIDSAIGLAMARDRCERISRAAPSDDP